MSGSSCGEEVVTASNLVSGIDPAFIYLYLLRVIIPHIELPYFFCRQQSNAERYQDQPYFYIYGCSSEDLIPEGLINNKQLKQDFSRYTNEYKPV